MAKSVETVALPIAHAMGGHHHPVQMSMSFTSVGKHLSLELDSQQIYSPTISVLCVHEDA